MKKGFYFSGVCGLKKSRRWTVCDHFSAGEWLRADDASGYGVDACDDIRKAADFIKKYGAERVRFVKAGGVCAGEYFVKLPEAVQSWRAWQGGKNQSLIGFSGAAYLWRAEQ